MIHVVASNDPIDVAWAAFDAAAIRLQQQYAIASGLADSNSSDAGRAAAAKDRMQAAQEVVRLWDEWRKLFLGPDEPRPAA